MASRVVQQAFSRNQFAFRSSFRTAERKCFSGQGRGAVTAALENRQPSTGSGSISQKFSPVSPWSTRPVANSHRRQVGTTADPPLDYEALPDTMNPYEHPLATVGFAELSEEKRYWRQRQAPRPVYVREVDENGVAYAIGKRKASVAHVWLKEGSGGVVVNGKDWVDYFPRVDLRDQIMRPLFLVESAGQMSIECSVSGGGSTGQAEALRHGISRALLKWNPDWRQLLKKDGLLTRDSRVVESKKAGRKKARKAFQWVKR